MFVDDKEMEWNNILLNRIKLITNHVSEKPPSSQYGAITNKHINSKTHHCRNKYFLKHGTLVVQHQNSHCPVISKVE